MIHGDLSADLLRTIFSPKSPLHDGAVDRPRRQDPRRRGAAAARRDDDPLRAVRHAPPRRAGHDRADRRDRRRRVRGERPDQPRPAGADRAQPQRGAARPGAAQPARARPRSGRGSGCPAACPAHARRGSRTSAARSEPAAAIAARSSRCRPTSRCVPDERADRRADDAGAPTARGRRSPAGGRRARRHEASWQGHATRRPPGAPTQPRAGGDPRTERMTRALRFILHNWPLKLAAIALASLLYGGLVLSQTTQPFTDPVPIRIENPPADVIVLSNLGSVTRISYVAPPDLGLRIDSTTFEASVDLSTVAADGAGRLGRRHRRGGRRPDPGPRLRAAGDLAHRRSHGQQGGSDRGRPAAPAVGARRGRPDPRGRDRRRQRAAVGRGDGRQGPGGGLDRRHGRRRERARPAHPDRHQRRPARRGGADRGGAGARARARARVHGPADEDAAGHARSWRGRPAAGFEVASVDRRSSRRERRGRRERPRRRSTGSTPSRSSSRARRPSSSRTSASCCRDGRPGARPGDGRGHRPPSPDDRDADVRRRGSSSSARARTGATSCRPTACS